MFCSECDYKYNVGVGTLQFYQERNDGFNISVRRFAINGNLCLVQLKQRIAFGLRVQPAILVEAEALPPLPLSNYFVGGYGKLETSVLYWPNALNYKLVVATKPLCLVCLSPDLFWVAANMDMDAYPLDETHVGSPVWNTLGVVVGMVSLPAPEDRPDYREHGTVVNLAKFRAWIDDTIQNWDRQ